MRRPSLLKFLVAGLAAATLAFGATLSAAAPVSSGDLNDAIPDNPNTPLSKDLAIDLGADFANAKITDVKVSVRIDHPQDGDLVLTLRHPDGTPVELSSNKVGIDYGNGSDDCNGTPTVFDDGAPTAIYSGAAVSPFAGSFKPVEALSKLHHKTPNGTWELEVKDSFGNGETGTLFCWALEVTVAVADLEVTLTDAPDPTSVGNELKYTAVVKNNGPDTASNAKLEWTLPSGDLVSATPTSTGPTCDTSKTPLVCDLGSLADDATVTIDVVVKPSAAGTASATAKATSDATDVPTGPPDNSSDTETTTVQADGSGGDQTITVETLGQGRGTVTSDPAGINCGTDCEGGYLAGTTVKLTATPAADSVFVAWGGACDGIAIDADCEVTAEGAKNVTAQFDKSSNGGGGGGNGGGVYDICTITGTAGKDTLRGTPGKDVICGLGGADTLYGLGGADRMYGGPGKDKVYGGAGNDMLFTSDKFADKLWGGKGKDKARGDVRDTMTGVEGFF